MGIYLLEAGISKPEFLGEGNSRLKKANQLMQKLMEHFYDFIIPGKKPQIPDKLLPHFHHSCTIVANKQASVWLTLLRSTTPPLSHTCTDHTHRLRDRHVCRHCVSMVSLR